MVVRADCVGSIVIFFSYIIAEIFLYFIIEI